MCKRISIITINRNCAVGLQKTIESVISQTFKDYEFIVIDGDSKDESVEVIKEYADKITYWLSEPDTGIYNAMNKGILKANGEYLFFLNSGDTLYDRNVFKNVFGVSHSSYIINGDMLKMFPNGTSELDKGQTFIRKSDNKDVTLYDMYIGNLNHQSTFISKELFKLYGLYDESYTIVSDWLFFLKVIGLNGVKVEYVNCIVSKFDMTGVSNNNEELVATERQKAIQDTIPMMILEDYKFFNEIHCNYINLQDRYNYLLHYRLTRVITKFVNSSLRLFDLRHKKGK